MWEISRREPQGIYPVGALLCQLCSLHAFPSNTHKLWKAAESERQRSFEACLLLKRESTIDNPSQSKYYYRKVNPLTLLEHFWASSILFCSFAQFATTFRAIQIFPSGRTVASILRGTGYQRVYQMTAAISCHRCRPCQRSPPLPLRPATLPAGKGALMLGRPLKCLIFSLMALIRDPIYEYFQRALGANPECRI